MYEDALQKTHWQGHSLARMCLQSRDVISEEDVIPFKIAVHDGEKNLKEQVDGVDQHRQQEQPRFSRHHGGFPSGRAGDCLADEEAKRRGKGKEKKKKQKIASCRLADWCCSSSVTSFDSGAACRREGNWAT